MVQLAEDGSFGELLHYRVDANDSQPAHMKSVGAAIGSLIPPDTVSIVIATFDYTAASRIKDWHKVRLRAEGAIAAVAEDCVSGTVILTGREMAAIAGETKDELEARARRLLSGSDPSAVSAALVAEVLSRDRS